MCHEAVKNILREAGYGLQLLRVPRVIRLVNGIEVLTASYAFLGSYGVLNLPNINNGDTIEEVHLSDKFHANPLDLLQ